MNPNEKETVMSSDVQVAVAVEETKEPARKLGFSGCDQTKVAIVTCELPTNILVQAQGKGRVLVDSMAKLDKVGIMVIVEDKGPGIKDVNKTLQGIGGSKKGLGIGLGGAKRLTDEFCYRPEWEKEQRSCQEMGE